MAKNYTKQADSDLGYGSVIYNGMIQVNLLKFNDDRSNRASLINNLRLRILLLRAMLSPFDGDEEFQNAIKDVKYITTSSRFNNTDADFDSCIKMYAALIQLAFKYQLVQPYQEEVIDDVESNELKYSTGK